MKAKKKHTALYMACTEEALSSAQLNKAETIECCLLRLKQLFENKQVQLETQSHATSKPQLMNGTASLISSGSPAQPRYVLVQNCNSELPSDNMGDAHSQLVTKQPLVNGASSLVGSQLVFIPNTPLMPSSTVSSSSSSLPGTKYPLIRPNVSLTQAREPQPPPSQPSLVPQTTISATSVTQSTERTAKFQAKAAISASLEAGTKNAAVAKTVSPDIEVLTERKAVTVTSTPSASTPHKPAVSPTKNVCLLHITVRAKKTLPVNEALKLRKELDTKVKSALVKMPKEFVEWLLSETLIRITQFCTLHRVKLKLGMFSDPKVLATSGGYVWISECCGRKYVSVYSGSIFGSTPIDKVPPTSVLKLIYHWSCQTSIQNVENWVKVDKVFISKMYHYFRCICSVMVQDKLFDFGSDSSTVELGVVSLGTSTPDGTRKAVKVEIVGLYHRPTESYRLFASSPEPGNSSRQRFARILKPIVRVIHPSANIICDQSIDKSCLHSLQYYKVTVGLSTGTNEHSSNSNIMGYLRRHVPKIFQNTLSQLTLEQVQLVLDELCWREKYGESASTCYQNMMDHIIYLTSREADNPGLLHLLDFVAENPLKNWKYKENQVPKITVPSLTPSILTTPPGGTATIASDEQPLKKTSPLQHSNKVAVPQLINLQLQPMKVSSKAMEVVHSQSHASQQNVKLVPLESYYYGEVKGNSSLGKESNHSEFTCHICCKEIDNNIDFYAHLKIHIIPHTFPVNKFLCDYCTYLADSQERLGEHVAVTHRKDGSPYCCRICTISFPSEELLVVHMSKKHEEAELPYRCEVCYYSTSFFTVIIDHFSEAHKGTPYVQCHSCLCVKHLTPSGSASFSSRVFQHLQRHSQRHKCGSCVLSFYSKYLLNEHKLKDHISCTSVPGFLRYKPLPGMQAIMFKPQVKVDPKAVSSQHLAWSKPSVAMSSTLMEYRSLNLINADKKYCIECDGPLKLPNHFVRYQKCTKCMYTTSCKNMIARHSQVFHPLGRKVTYVIGASIPLFTDMYCACGFNTKSGNHLAKHLATCPESTKTAYPHHPSESPRREEITDYRDLDILPVSVEISEDA